MNLASKHTTSTSTKATRHKFKLINNFHIRNLFQFTTIVSHVRYITNMIPISFGMPILLMVVVVVAGGKSGSSKAEEIERERESKNIALPSN